MPVKRILLLLTAVLVLLSAAGCASPFASEYYYEEPFDSDFGSLSGDATEVRNDSMLKTVLTNLIIRHSEQAELRLSNYTGNPTEDLAKVCYEIKSSNPLGSYAVESLSYDLSYVVSYYVATIRITYQRTAEEIASVYYAGTQADFENHLQEAVRTFSPQLVSRIYSSSVNKETIARVIQQFYYDNPVLFVAEPTAEVDMYPGTGTNEIYDIRFHYPMSEQRVQTMSAEMALRIQEILEDLPEEGDEERALEAAVLLSNLCKDGSGEGVYADSAYGALMRGDADSKGYALAYRALCQELGIECTVIEGGIGSMGGEPHYWNLLRLEEDYYHADISAFDQDPFSAFLLKDEQLWGKYIWETGNYPSCNGNLTYAEVAGIEEEPETIPEIQPENDANGEPGEENEPEESPEPNAEEPDEKPEEEPAAGKP